MDIKEINAAIASQPRYSKNLFRCLSRAISTMRFLKALGIPLGTVKSRIFLARQDLQKALRDMPFGSSPAYKLLGTMIGLLYIPDEMFRLFLLQQDNRAFLYK